jgi:hypothetical protein
MAEKDPTEKSGFAFSAESSGMEQELCDRNNELKKRIK